MPRRKAFTRNLAVFAVLSLLAAGLAASPRYRAADGTFDPLEKPTAVGGRVTLHSVPLINGKSADVSLERVNVWRDDAKVVLYTDQGVEVHQPQAILQYRGSVDGDPDSIVVIIKSASGTRGFVSTGGQRFSIHTAAGKPNGGTYVDDVTIMDETSGGKPWQCDLDRSPVSLRRPRIGNGEATTQSLATSTAWYQLNIAVDTDSQFFRNFGSSAYDVQNYITYLVISASALYQRDLQTQLRLSYLGIVTSGSDPFTMNPGDGTQTATDALLELGQIWHQASGNLSDPRNIGRSAAILVSGKPQRTGTAWIGTMCGGDWPSPSPNVPAGFGGAYAVVGGAGLDSHTVPFPNDNYYWNPQYAVTVDPSDDNYWTLVGFAHELGHVVQSYHTHCVALTLADKSLYGRSTVDQCYSGETTLGTCYSDGTSGPVDGPPARVPTESGTIMSLCQLTTNDNASHTTHGYGTAIRYLFGKAGEASHVVVDNMKSALSAATPGMSAITAPSSIADGATGTASVSPISGVSYLWNISNGTITSGQGTNSITFTGSYDPVMIGVVATNITWCSVTDYVNVHFNQATVPVPTNVAAQAMVVTLNSATVQVSWSNVSGASSYEVARSTDGTNYTVVGNVNGTPFNDGSAQPGTAYFYKVRSVDSQGARSGYSTPDLATAVHFTNDPVSIGTGIYAYHYNELRAAVTAICNLAGNHPAACQTPFAETITSRVTYVKAVHLTEIRAKLDGARAWFGLSAVQYEDPVITNTTYIRAKQVNEIIGGVK